MALAAVLLCIQALVRTSVGQYVCPEHTTDLDGTPKCAGIDASTCTPATCCTVPEYCSQFSVAWVLAQAAGGGCAEDTKFFDTKLLNKAVAPADATEAQIKSACCTPFADATCYDWNSKVCPASKVRVNTNAAPPDGDDGMSLSDTKFEELCCEVPPDTCSNFQVDWLSAQVTGGGCGKQEIPKFFDLKTLDTSVVEPVSYANIKAACCTPYSEATCADWNTMFCPLDKVNVGTNAAPADGEDGTTLTQEKFEELCCEVAPTTCSSFSATWLTAQVLGGGCAEDTKFFDLKLLATEVAGPAEDAEIKDACCTPFAEATCADWNTMSCPADHVLAGTNSAPADGDDGKSLSQSKFEELCCEVSPNTCSKFSAAWLTAQVLGAGCAEDTKFFDLKLATTEVADPAGDAEIKAACCTPFADATCADWNTMFCPTSKLKVGTNSAPADGDDGKSLSDAKFEELCCEEPPEPPNTCNKFSADWLTAQFLGFGCASEPEFFDLHKLSAVVSGPAADSDIKAACCTPHSEATCADWNTMFCPLDKVKVGTNAAPADGLDGVSLSESKFEELCCEVAPTTCNSFSATWLTAQVSGGGCAEDTKFFDLKLLATEVADPAEAAEIKAACCTPFADATCADWNTMYCPTGKVKAGTNSAPADGDDGKTLSGTKFEELCCVEPLTCEEWATPAPTPVPTPAPTPAPTSAEEVSAAFASADALPFAMVMATVALIRM